ncbi:MAG: S9 family peptidase [Gammaproteobacteria bacterium]|nr:S9 family peptidase [Gammaproteobacteria bacterium]
MSYSKLTILIVLSTSFIFAGCSDDNSKEIASSSSKQQEKNMIKVNAEPVKAPVAPVARKDPYSMEAHGHTRVDNYYWMRDDERKDPEILAHLEKENAYTEAMLSHTKTMQAILFKEITGRIEKKDNSVPYKKGEYWYYSRYEQDKEYPIYARKKQTLDAEEEITLDVNVLAKGHEYYSASGLTYSPDAKILVYGEDTVSRRIYTLKFKDLQTGEMLSDVIKEANSSIAWASDNKTLFYVKKDLQTLLGNKVYRHELGTPQTEDVLVFEEKNNQLYIDLSRSDDGSTITISRSNSTSAGSYYLDADNPGAAFNEFHPFEEFVQYEFQSSGEYYFITSSKDAVNFQLYKVKKSQRDDQSKWQLLIPHREDVLLSGVELFNDYIVVIEKKDGLNNLVIYSHDGNLLKHETFDDAAYSMGLSSNPVDDTDTVRISYSSLTTPSSIIDINMKTAEREIKKQDKVLGDFDANRYKSERFFVPARDGKSVPVSLVYRKDRFKKDGSNPLYQYAYGSYGASISPRFRSSSLSLMDRGFVYAIAHIRGSSTMGRQWYEDGKLLNKKNTFTDFIDVTKYLIEHKYSSADRIVAAGGSAGGLLIGAVANMAPELYLGLSAHVPWVDVITTMSDPSIPLTTNEYTEWGNPADKEYYDYMLSYSPYDQVNAQDYPHLFITTGLHDSQVQYFEPSKWVAKLREFKTDSNRLLYDVNMDAGHGGSSGRFKRYKIMAKEYAFYFDLLNIKE